MKITKSQLKQVIREELESVMSEHSAGRGMYRNAQQYASAHMMHFCKAGWSINKASTLWGVSGGGRMPWQSIVASANEDLEKYGKESVIERYGLQEFLGSVQDCDSLAPRGPRRRKRGPGP